MAEARPGSGRAGVVASRLFGRSVLGGNACLVLITATAAWAVPISTA
jgi:hypothetical protein